MPEYSISQLGTFEECALQYRLIYVDRIKRYEEGVEAFLGQRFHEAMEWLYQERAFRGVAIVDAYAERWRKKRGLEAEVKAVAEGRWAGDILERVRAYVSTEKRYAVTLKEES
jgi:ATP-dependent helicase/DNAse subunit B